MWLKPRHLFLLVPLLFVTAAQATPNDPPTPGKGPAVSASVPKPHSTNVEPQLRSGSRYGVGYEARHGIDAGGPGDRGDRVERPERIERPERVERPERIERDGRGR